MEPIPLIPKSTVKSNHDSSHVVRESFQELLARSHYPTNVMKNMSKFTVEMEDLKNNALFTQYTYNKHLEKVATITEAERELMEHHGIYLIGKEVLAEDKSLTECLQLRRHSLLPDVRKQHANAFGLIKQDTLLPNIVERAIDFRLNSNRHHCVRKCLSSSDISAPDVKKSKSKLQELSPEKSGEIIFQATPSSLVFHNYQLNVSYKKVIKIRNVTKIMRSIALKVLPKTKYFTIMLETTCRVAPGMCAVYSIVYCTDIYRDVEETIRFTTYTGKNVIVKLKSCSYSPSLRVYIFKSGITLPERISKDALVQSDFDIERTMALNSSIDCGCTLVGQEIKLSLIMKNEGGYGKFFFINESDWYHYSLVNVNKNMVLLAGTFQLYPVYFEVNENEFVEVMISFFPKSFGLFVDTVYLLCSNNTCEELDLIGDGVYFEKSFITFDLKAKECQPFFLDYESKYCVHVGKTLCCQTITATIKVENKSPLNLDYRWTVRKSENAMIPDFKHLASHWVTIQDKSKFLPYYTTNDFLISINPETTDEGLYRIVLCLYIENIPEISLRDHQDFTVIERDDSKSQCKLVDVLVGEIELLVDVEGIGVIIEPNPLIIPFHPHANVTYKEKIKIIPESTYKLRCQWKHHKTNKGTVIEPRTFELNSRKLECTVTVNRTEAGSLNEQFLLWVNDGVFKVYFQVLLTTELPRVSLNPSALIFDDLMNQFLYDKTISIENPSSANVFWHLIEETLDPAKGTITVEDDGMRLFPSGGFLRAGETCQVRYRANTSILGENLSYLKVYTNFTDKDKFDAISYVRYNVCRPEILVHTNTSELPILCPTDLLFVGIEERMHVCIHNIGNIVAIFLWGQPTGTSANDFDFAISPRIGIIRRQEIVHVDFTIKPKSMGYFEDVYVPLFVLGIDKVILVKLMCLVGDIAVNVYIPDVDDEYIPILWPKIISDEYQEICAPEFSRIVLRSTGEELSSLEYPGEDTFFEDTSYKTLTDYPTGLLYLNESNEEEGSETMLSMVNKQSLGFDVPDSTTTSSTTTSATESSTYTPKRSIKEIIRKLFKDNMPTQQYCIEFQKVPLRTPVKKSIKIENLTPGEGLVYAEAVNFYQEVERKNVINDVLAKLKIAKSTEWEDIVTPEGIVVKIDEPSRELHAFEIIEFNIWVYANTWGYYLDELVIDISQMLPFSASLLIEVVGLPIEYPFAQNSIRSEPIVRMGVLPYKSAKVQRRVKVVNTSVCTVYISWQIFLNVEEKRRKSFSVLFDIPITDREFEECDSQPKFVLTNEYYGQTNANYFEIEPPTSQILPGEFKYVDVTVIVNHFDEAFLKKSIFANLVGIIKVPCGCRIQPNLYVRPHGVDIGCTKVKITFAIDLPTLVVDDLPDKIRMSTYASDIMEKELFQATRRLLLKNPTQTRALVYLDIEKPFKIVSVKIPHVTFKEFASSVVINPEETMEIVLQCTLSKEDILDIVDNLKVGTKNVALTSINFVENSLRISKRLSVYQRGLLQTMIPLELKVFFPIFKAHPVHIQFGNVFIGNTAKQITSLRNMTGSPLRFEVYKMNKYPEFIITPNKGIIPKFTTGTESVLSIFFTPTEPKTYLLWFAVETALPHHFIVINVVGVGMYDENFYRPGLH